MAQVKQYDWWWNKTQGALRGFFLPFAKIQEQNESMTIIVLLMFGAFALRCT